MTAPRLRDLKGLIFDCDGVMIDSTDSNREFYNLILEHYGLPRMRPDQEAYSFMATSTQALKALLPERLHPEIPRMGREVVNYRERIMPLVRVYPGFGAFIDFLRGHGLRLAVLTNRTDGGIRPVLSHFGWESFFDPVVTASSCPPKPSPEGAGIVLDAWRCRADQVLFVGDSEVDRRTAEAAGIPFAAFGAGCRLEGEFRVEDYASFEKLLLPRLGGR